MKLKDYRKQKGLTQKQLAKQLGVSQQKISKWEKEGKTIEGIDKTGRSYKVGNIVQLKTWEELQHAPGFVGIDEVGDLQFPYNYFTREMEKALKKDREVEIIGVAKDPTTKYEIKLNGNYYRIYPEWIKQEAGVKKEKDIILHFEKFVDKDGNKKARLIEAENIMPFSKLPKSYLQDAPFFYRDNHTKREIYVNTGKNARWYVVGDELEIEEVNAMTEAMRIAADRLHRIKDGIRKAKEEWQGEMEVRI